MCVCVCVCVCVGRPIIVYRGNRHQTPATFDELEGILIHKLAGTTKALTETAAAPGAIEHSQQVTASSNRVIALRYSNLSFDHVSFCMR